MGSFDDLVPQKKQNRFDDLVPPNRSSDKEEVLQSFGEQGVGPVGADQDFDVEDLIDAGILAPENIKGRSLGEIASDPEIQRQALEIGGMTIGSFVAPEITGPIAVARYPKVFNLIKQILGAGVGGGAGSFHLRSRSRYVRS